jgi:hypothetical protein
MKIDFDPKKAQEERENAWKNYSGEFLEKVLVELAPDKRPTGHFGPNEDPHIWMLCQLVDKYDEIQAYVAAGNVQGSMTPREAEDLKEICCRRDLGRECDYKFLNSIGLR